MLRIITSRFLTPNLPESQNKCGQHEQKFMYTPTMPIFTRVTYTELHYAEILYIESPKSVNKNEMYEVEVHLRRFSQNSCLVNNFYFVNKRLTEFHENPANGSIADTCSRTDRLMDGCGKGI